MALTLEQMAVQFSSTGDALVIAAFKNIADASDKTRKVVTQNFEQTATISKGAVKKIENLSIQLAFAFATMANDGKVSFQTLLSGISSLGFAFGPVVGAITTAAGAIANALISNFQRARDEAKKTADQIIENIRRIGASGSLLQAGERLRQLYSGDKFISPDDPLAALIKGGGLEAANRQLAAITAKRDAILATRPAGGIFGSPEEQEAFNKAIAALQPAFDKAKAAVASLRSEYEPLAKLFDDLNKKASDQTATGLALAQTQRGKELALAQHRYDLEVAMLEGNIAKQAELTAGWVDTAARLYGRDSQEYKDAQLEKLKFATQMKNDLAKSAAATLDALKLAPVAVTPSSGEKLKSASDAIFASVTEVWKKNKPKLEQANAEMWDGLAAQAEAALQPYRAIVGNIGGSIGQSLTAGITEALHGGGLSGALSAFGDVILGALGGFFTRWGEALLGFGAIMEKLAAWMLAHPIFSGPAAIAAGVAMIALGSTLSGLAGGGGGGGGGGAAYSAAIPSLNTSQSVAVAPYTSYPESAATTAGMTAVTPVTVNATIIGKDDPRAQREILELVNRAQLRGNAGV